MSETTAQTLARLTAFIQEKAPNIDLAPGSVFSELILGLEGQIQNQVYNDINAISVAQAIKDVEASIVDTYSPVIDGIASNYDVTRNQGAVSVGVVKVYTTNQYTSNFTVPTGTGFIQPTLGYTYVTTSPVVILSGSLIPENGLFYFTIPVSSVDVGQHTSLSNGAPFSLTSTSSIPYFTQATAYGTFSQGKSPETDKQLISRFREGLAVSNLLTSASINHKLSTLFPGFCGAYLADSTSPINTRSQISPLGIKIPGCVDVYVKNDTTIPTITFPVIGFWNGSQWILSINSSVAPGFYRIVSITDAAATDLTYLPFTATYGTSGGTNLIQNPSQSRYSSYQSASVAVSYIPPSGPPFTFNVTVMAPFALMEVQNLLLDNSNRIPCADYLAKGIVPCMVNMALSLVRNSNSDVVDTVSLQADIFNYISSLTIGQSIAVSQIVKLCHKYNIARVDLPIVLNGKILAPYDNTGTAADKDIIIEGNDFLQIPNLPQYGVTAGNTMFFINYFSETGQQNININVK